MNCQTEEEEDGGGNEKVETDHDLPLATYFVSKLRLWRKVAFIGMVLMGCAALCGGVVWTLKKAKVIEDRPSNNPPGVLGDIYEMNKKKK